MSPLLPRADIKKMLTTEWDVTANIKGTLTLEMEWNVAVLLLLSTADIKKMLTMEWNVAVLLFLSTARCSAS